MRGLWRVARRIMGHLLQAQVNSILRAIDAQTLKLQTSLLATEHRIMAAFDDLKASFAAETAKVDALLAAFSSTKSTLADVSAQLAALQAAGNASPADLQALQAQVDAESAKIDAAMAPAPAP